MMTIQQLIKSLGGDVAVSSHVGRRLATIRSWRHRDSIPPEVFPMLVVLARKQRVPGVTLESLYALRGKHLADYRALILLKAKKSNG